MNYDSEYDAVHSAAVYTPAAYVSLPTDVAVPVIIRLNNECSDQLLRAEEVLEKLPEEPLPAVHMQSDNIPGCCLPWHPVINLPQKVSAFFIYFYSFVD